MNKVLGLDLGTVTLGIAKSDSLGFVHGVETFRFDKNQYIVARKHVYDLCKSLEINEIALGLPLRLNQSESEMSMIVRRFKDDLEKEHPELKITLVDERLSSVSAHNALSMNGVNHQTRMQKVDMYAACIILETYIGMKGNK